MPAHAIGKYQEHAAFGDDNLGAILVALAIADPADFCCLNIWMH
jgi:hypothetical protein